MRGRSRADVGMYVHSLSLPFDILASLSLFPDAADDSHATRCTPPLFAGVVPDGVDLYAARIGILVRNIKAYLLFNIVPCSTDVNAMAFSDPHRITEVCFPIIDHRKVR